MCLGSQGGQKMLESLELELQVIGSCLMWVLGTELQSVRIACALNKP